MGQSGYTVECRKHGQVMRRRIQVMKSTNNATSQFAIVTVPSGALHER